MRHLLGSWSCRSGNSVDAYLHIEGRSFWQLDLEWDAPPPLSEQDLVDYLTIILPSLTKAPRNLSSAQAPRWWCCPTTCAPDEERVNKNLDLLLSVVYDPARVAHPAHLADLRKSGLADVTIRAQKITDVPPGMIDPLLGFPTPAVTSAYLLPFPDPCGGWMDHVRVKVFPSITKEHGTIKYLQPRRSGVRIYFPLVTLDTVLRSAEPLYIVEGEKKSLAVAQLDLPAVGICGIEGWHVAGSRDLHPDLDDVGLVNRLVNVVPDADVQTNPAVHLAVLRLGQALRARGATARLVLVPREYKGIDDYLAASL